MPSLSMASQIISSVAVEPFGWSVIELRYSKVAICPLLYSSKNPSINTFDFLPILPVMIPRSLKFGPPLSAFSKAHLACSATSTLRLVVVATGDPNPFKRSTRAWVTWCCRLDLPRKGIRVLESTRKRVLINSRCRAFTNSGEYPNKVIPNCACRSVPIYLLSSWLGAAKTSWTSFMRRKASSLEWTLLKYSGSNCIRPTVWYFE